jgi:hypothetical protein
MRSFIQIIFVYLKPVLALAGDDRFLFFRHGPLMLFFVCAKKAHPTADL